MALSKVERNQRIDGILASLCALRGVVSAAVVDHDGFVTHIRRDFEIDADALGAAVQIVYASAGRAANQVEQGQTRLVLCENEDGIMIFAPVARGSFTLAIVADGSAMLGALRFEIKGSVPELDQLFGVAA